MAISQTIGIDMPGDFPAAAHDAVSVKLGPYQPRDPAVWTEYAGGWNAVAYRFKTTTVADGTFTASIRRSRQTLDEHQIHLLRRKRSLALISRARP